ncbi:elements of external origin [Profundibacter sp.]
MSHSAVRKAISAGRITLEADGTIDPEKADRQWDTQTDPSKQRGKHARAMGSRFRTSTKPVPKSAIKAVDETLREDGTGDGGGEVSFLRAKMANEVLKAQTARVRLQKMKGELVDREKATSMVFDLARRERDAWQNWPPRVAADMAAELGVDAHTMEQVLDKHLRKQLGELAEIDIELR